LIPSRARNLSVLIAVRRSVLPPLCILIAAFLFCPTRLRAQAGARLLISSGSDVPGNPGFVFGPFSGLAMSAHRQIAFLSTIHSERNDRKVITRSTGVSFSVVVFQGLVSPVPRMLFDSFSAPSINASGAIAFSAKLAGMDEGTPPSSGVFLAAGESVQLIAAAGQNVPGQAATFQEISPPVIGSSGAVLFAARSLGSQASSGLYLWSAHGLAKVELPADVRPGPAELLVPVFQSQDESVWAPRDVPADSALDQFFRAIAAKNFEQLNPPPQPSDTVTVLGPALSETPVRLLLVVLDGGKAETAELQGDPTQPVVAKLSSGPPLDMPLAGVQGQVPGAVTGTVVFAAAPLAHPDDLALYCFCNGQAVRLTSPQDFAFLDPGSRLIGSMAGDGQQTVAFIAPAQPAQQSNAIYVITPQ
jgi:hypothetical protein